MNFVSNVISRYIMLTFIFYHLKCHKTFKPFSLVLRAIQFIPESFISMHHLYPKLCYRNCQAQIIYCIAHSRVIVWCAAGQGSGI